MSRSSLEVADIFRTYGPAWRRANAGHLSLAQLKVMSAIGKLPDRSPRRACRGLRKVRPPARFLQFVPQPALSEVPGTSGLQLDAGPCLRPLASRIFSRGLHPAGTDRPNCSAEQGGCLRSLVQGIVADTPDDRCRPQTSGRKDRHDKRSAHLGIRAEPSPPCAYRRAGRRLVALRQAMDFLPSRLLPASEGPVQFVPEAIPGRA